MDTQIELKNSKDIIVYLSEKFPNCFMLDGEAKPLKIGIFQDLAERLSVGETPIISKTRLRLALRLYTASWRYLHCIKLGANRVDIDGHAVEPITEEQVNHAQEKLKESKEIVKQKRIAQAKNNPKEPKNKANPKSAKPQSKSEVRKPQPKKQPLKIQTTPADIEKLNVGDKVNVVLGSKPVSAEITAIEKDIVKVKVASGMELAVNIKHILL